MPINRRLFLQTSAASCLVSALPFKTSADAAQTSEPKQSFRFEGSNYVFEWSSGTDHFRILNHAQEVITSGPVQPIVIVQSPGQTVRRATSGKLESHHVDGDRVIWTYFNVNGSSRLSVAWRFEASGFWMEPATYESSAKEDIVSFNLFAASAGDCGAPALSTPILVVPGICESQSVSPIVDADVGLHLRTSLGRAGNDIYQQWALPSHYFAGFRRATGGYPENPADSNASLGQAFCCGLTQLPNADLYLEQEHGRVSVAFDYRGDLWGHLRGPAKVTLGARLFWAIAPDYHQAIRAYYRGLLSAGIIHQKVNSPAKATTMLAPQWSTWGSQMVDGKEGSNLDQAGLEKFYQDLKSSGMSAGLFSIDDQWEGKYGGLEHSPERLPHFEQFLEKLRGEGLRLGLWAAFMRCEDPSSLGLTPEQLLRKPDGKPCFHKHGTKGWYLLDFTRPEVQQVLRERARQFVRRYKPDLVKFDFGYEIPALDALAPHDMAWAGERMMAKALEVVVGAMREENPDIVLMYYQVSPLFAEYLDLHSIDDLGLSKGEYAVEANRRFFFSGLCGEFGMPTYGSSGYDWASAPDIWFDSVAIGTVGSLVSFDRDDAGGKATPSIIAKYNGLTHLVRPATQFTIQPLDPVFVFATRGAHASSWARFENDQPVLVALRTQRLDGGPGKTEFGNIVKTSAAAVVASKTEDALDRAARLAIVPFGEGQLTLKHQPHASVAEITEHYFGGKSRASRLQIEEGSLLIPLRQSAEDGSPVEWIEVEISG